MREAVCAKRMLTASEAGVDGADGPGREGMSVTVYDRRDFAGVLKGRRGVEVTRGGVEGGGVDSEAVRGDGGVDIFPRYAEYAGGERAVRCCVL